MDNGDMNEQGFPVPRIPVATYRLQFNHFFRFSDAVGLIKYLHDLGITDIYASPYFKAKKGSLHGYDIVDPSALNPEIGTREEYEALIEELKKYDMGQVADIVPNHMCCDSSNLWWMDVLENGLSSPYEKFFDINWNPAVRRLSGKLLIPLLGDQYGKTLEKQELKLTFEEGAFFIYYQELKLPIAPETYISILQFSLEDLQNTFRDEADITELLSIITALKHLPAFTEKDPERAGERYREKEIIKKRILTLYRDSSRIKNFIDGNVSVFNGVKGDPASFNLLDALLAEQVWRPSHWRVATEEINYRRFFDINETSAIRVEDQAVFDETHKLVLTLIGEGKITGLRVDHPDGLYNPTGYFEGLQKVIFERLTLPKAENEGPEVSTRYNSKLLSDPQYRPFYIVGEKILTKGEKMPEDWRVLGTTGYAFLNSVNGIFIDTENAKMFDKIYARFTGTYYDFAGIVYDKKKLVIQGTLSSEINTLGHYLNRISDKNRHTRDFTLNSLTKAITEVAALFPVYRTYINSLSVGDKDRQYIEAAVSRAKRLNPGVSSSIFDFLSDVLLLRFPEDFPEGDKWMWLDFIMRFQQLTAPIMAKGLEDTAFYIYNRLVSLNEVGGSPDRFGLSLDAFHGQNMERFKYWPHALLASATHDTKRGEDVRARINVLSEVPEIWKNSLTKWSYLNKKKKVSVDGQDAPDRNEEYLLYQSLIGVWPAGQEDKVDDSFRGRIRDYIVKAMREAKVNTSWINPNQAYEDAVTSFVDTILSPGTDNGFLTEFSSFQKKTAFFGMLNSLAQTLLKIVSPGVPDFYQGTELFDLSLVDPDNRRPVDYTSRKKALEALKMERSYSGMDLTGFLKGLLDRWEDGSIKLYVIARALAYRKEYRGLFMNGAYIPLAGEGELGNNFCGIARQEDNKTVLAVVPRLVTRAMDLNPAPPVGEKLWGETAIVIPDEIHGGKFKNVLTEEQIGTFQSGGKRVLYMREVLASFPVALLTVLS